MRLFYYQDPAGNFGDDLNPWLWSRLIPGLLDDDDNCLFVGIGSILDRRIPQAPRKGVFGTGSGYDRLPVIDERWRICCVRGPLTADALGLPAELAITDPAALVRTVAPPQAAKLYPVSFIPHFRTPARTATRGVDLRSACEEAGIHYINPSGAVADVLGDIQSSELVVAEAMHGAIVADALRVPWVPVRLYEHILGLKWWDWCKSLGLDYKPEVLPVEQAATGRGIANFLQHLKSSGRPTLSADRALNTATERLLERLDWLRFGCGERCFNGSMTPTPNPEVFKQTPWLYEMHVALREIATLVPQGRSFILVDELKWGGGEVLAGRHAIPFTEREGEYWGPPPDDETGIREVERLRQAGAHSIVFAWPAFWWLDYYIELHHYLCASFPCVLENKRLIVFRLSP